MSDTRRLLGGDLVPGRVSSWQPCAQATPRERRRAGTAGTSRVRCQLASPWIPAWFGCSPYSISLCRHQRGGSLASCRISSSVCIFGTPGGASPACFRHLPTSRLAAEGFDFASNGPPRSLAAEFQNKRSERMGRTALGTTCCITHATGVRQSQRPLRV